MLVTRPNCSSKCSNKRALDSFNMLNDVMCALFLSSLPLPPFLDVCVCACASPTLHATILSCLFSVIVTAAAAAFLPFFWVFFCCFVLGALLFCWFPAFIVALVIWNADNLGRPKPLAPCWMLRPKIDPLNS